MSELKPLNVDAVLVEVEEVVHSIMELSRGYSGHECVKCRDRLQTSFRRLGIMLENGDVELLDCHPLVVGQLKDTWWHLTFISGNMPIITPAGIDTEWTVVAKTWGTLLKYSCEQLRWIHNSVNGIECGMPTWTSRGIILWTGPGDAQNFVWWDGAWEATCSEDVEKEAREWTFPYSEKWIYPDNEKRMEESSSSDLTETRWNIGPGKVVYNGITTIELNGIRFKILQALVESEKPLTEQELIEAGWGHDSDKEPKTLQNKLSELRGILRSKLRLGSQDPIPVVDNGRNRAWKIADSLRKAAES